MCACNTNANFQILAYMIGLYAQHVFVRIMVGWLFELLYLLWSHSLLASNNTNFHPPFLLMSQATHTSHRIMMRCWTFVRVIQLISLDRNKNSLIEMIVVKARESFHFLQSDRIHKLHVELHIHWYVRDSHVFSHILRIDGKWNGARTILYSHVLYLLVCNGNERN